MKILLVLDCPTTFINGVSQSVLNLEQGLRALGHDVRLLVPSPDGKGRVEGTRYLVPSVGCSAAYPGLRISVVLTKKMRDALLAWKPDVIHSNTEGALYFKAARLAKKTGAKHIHSFHTNILDFYYTYLPFGKRVSQALMAAYVNTCFRRMDGVIMPSLWGQERMARLHFSAPQYVLPNGIHTEDFAADRAAARTELRRRYSVTEEETLLLFVGRVAEEKNLCELLFDFEKIQNPSVKLMIVGGGPSLSALQKQAAKSSARERIVFTDMVPTDRVADYYAAADVFVTASLSEVQPLTYVEAMASGLPVVCADAPYIEGLVQNGETGFAFRSAAEFTAAIDTLSRDAVGRRQTGQRARERVMEAYSVEAFAKEGLRIYSDVLKGGVS